MTVCRSWSNDDVDGASIASATPIPMHIGGNDCSRVQSSAIRSLKFEIKLFKLLAPNGFELKFYGVPSCNTIDRQTPLF